MKHKKTSISQRELEVERLNFSMPDFCRSSWVSNEAREVWEPRLDKIRQAWGKIEWLSIAAGIRKCCLTITRPEDLVELVEQCRKNGLAVLPLKIIGVSSSYMTKITTFQPGKQFLYRVVIGNQNDVNIFKKAWDSKNDELMGKLLGYPKCCRDFFQKIWNENHFIDTTWNMAFNVSSDNKENIIEVSNIQQTNILWRWLGIRMVPHLPCSFNCVSTIYFGKKFYELGCKLGFENEMKWLQEILSWSVEWSALHGIAEIKTPLLKISTNTDPTYNKHVVRCKGTSHPKTASDSLMFPNVKFDKKDPPNWYHTDNGFFSLSDMNKSHKPIVDLAVNVLQDHKANVLDLGCGNGMLLKKIKDCCPQISLFGVDYNSSSIEHAKILCPDDKQNFYVADIFSTNLWQSNHYDLVILTPGRLLETDPKKVDILKKLLVKHSDKLLVYAYGDWLHEHGSLERLASMTGLQLLSHDSNAGVSLAEVNTVRSKL